MTLPLHAKSVSEERPPNRRAPVLEDEHSLVERIAEGDESAFELLFKTYYATLHDFALCYVRSSAVAEEIVQSILCKVWELRRTWEPLGGVRACLFASCRNAAIDYLRHEEVTTRMRSVAVATEEVPALGQAPAAPDDAAEAVELTEAIRAAVAELPERRRTVVILRWQHELGSTEIARVMGITVKGVEAHFARAVADLRVRLAHWRR